MSILCFIALRMITQYDNIDLAIRENKLILEKMCTHSHQRKANDYMQRCVMSAFLLCVLQKSGYFERRTTESGMLTYYCVYMIWYGVYKFYMYIS